jgi:hypothetical protein
VCPQISAPRTPIQAKKPNVFNATRPPDRPKYAHSPQTQVCVLALMIQRAAEIATGTPWSQLADVLERLKAVRYTAEGETIVQASRIGPELAAILKKLDISRPKPILAVG